MQRRIKFPRALWMHSCAASIAIPTGIAQECIPKASGASLVNFLKCVMPRSWQVLSALSVLRALHFSPCFGLVQPQQVSLGANGPEYSNSRGGCCGFAVASPLRCALADLLRHFPLGRWKLLRHSLWGGGNWGRAGIAGRIVDVAGRWGYVWARSFVCLIGW